MKRIACLISIAIACAWLGMVSPVNALTIGDTHDLGLISKNQPASPSSSQGFVDILLSRPLGSGPTTIGANDYTRTTNDPLAGVYPSAAFDIDLGAITNINLGNGYLYLLAKYDGPNWGSEVWYVGDLSGDITIPQFPTGNQYGISHVYLFNGSGGGPSARPDVPDSGTTISLLAVALIGIGLFGRFTRHAV